jgi:Pumilio-family RNA binding repeat
VIQKVISSFDAEKRNFVFEEVFEHFLDLAMNTNGLCVIKKLVTCTNNSEQGQRLMEKISENVIELV